MHFRFLLMLAAVMFAFSQACETPRIFVEEGMLEFDQDTVAFDSIFTTFQAPSERLIVYNNTDNNVQISRVWLDAGSGSEFSLIVDGIKADDVEGTPLAKGDSMHIFVTFKSALRDMYAEEYINFQIGDTRQQVLIRAKVIDAYLIKTLGRDSLGNQVILGSSVITKDTTLATDKFIVIDGPLIVDEGATLTIAAGTSIYFTPSKLDDNSVGSFEFDARLFSMIYVGDGTLKIEGTAMNPVVMQGTRFDSLYMENPAQWRGLWFSQESHDNEITHALIKNGLIGLRVDSTAFNGNPKLKMRFTEIRNMGAYGIWGLGFDPNGLGNAPLIDAENCLIHNCGERTALLTGGGHYEFHNCTFGNYLGRSPTLFAQNYLYDPVVDAIIGQYDLKAHFFNSVFWGTNEEEILLEDFGSTFDVRFDHCIVKTSTDPDRMYDYSPFFFDTDQNQDPLFNDPRMFDFRPRENSPVIDKGLDFSSRYDVDIRDNFGEFPRDGVFDLGAYEYYPIPE